MKKLRKTVAIVVVFAVIMGLMPSISMVSTDAAEDTVRYECEDTTVCTINAVTGANSRLTSRSGFSTLDGASTNAATFYSGDSITFTINDVTAGQYTLTLCYAANTSRDGTITVNSDDPINHSFTNWLGSGNGYITLGTDELVITLVDGTNTITIEETDANDSYFLNFDYIELTPYTNDTGKEEEVTYPAAVGRHEAEDADYGENTLQNDDYYSSNSNGAVVGISGAWASNDYNYIAQTVNAEKAGTYTLTVAYASTSDVELLYKIGNGDWTMFNESDPDTYVLPNSGSWVTTATATATITLEEGLNTIYITGPIVDWNANWFAVYDSTGWPSANIDYFELALVDESTTSYNITVDGAVVATVEKGGKYTFEDATYGYYDAANSVAYPAGYALTEITDDVEVTSINELSVSIYEGAGIKLDTESQEPVAGIRFQAAVTTDNEDALDDTKVITTGMLITAKDIYDEIGGSVLDQNSDYTFKNIVNDEDAGWYKDTVGSYCGSIVNIVESNYIRNFIARAYVIVNYVDGTTSEPIYSGMSDARSIQYVATCVQNDTTAYAALTDAEKALVDMYAQ